MGNKHSQGPRCPRCPRRFRTVTDLEQHQRSKCHFAIIPERTEDEHARARLQAYHQDKVRGAK